jgi:hypothetical protein
MANSAVAWSSQASRTQMDVKQLAYAVDIYRDEVGKYPEPERYWLQLQNAGATTLRETNAAPVDHWGHPLVYRHPGKKGNFDLYSVGPDGVDNNGGLDDVSVTGVNDGFHWKATWPAGRLTLRLGFGLALGACLLGLVWPWRFVIPVAGMILCAGTMIGCWLLMHPGVVRERNQPLELYVSMAALVFCVLLSGLLLCVWMKIFGNNRPLPPPLAT